MLGGAGQDGDAGAGEGFGGGGEGVGRCIAEAVGVADGDLAAEAQSAGAFGDEVELEQAERAAFVEVDIDALVVLFGEAEDDVEAALGVAVDIGGVEAADQVGAFAEGGVEKVGGAGGGEDAALREGDDLDVDVVGVALADAQRRLRGW